MQLLSSRPLERSPNCPNAPIRPKQRTRPQAVLPEKFAPFGVLKLIKGRDDRSDLPPITAELGTALADHAAEAAMKLRSSKVFTDRFGSIVRMTLSLGIPAVLQERGEGARFKDLRADLRAIAKAHIAEIVDAATELFPEILFSRSSGDFLFDPGTGRVTSWFDVVADSAKSSRQRGLEPLEAQLAERTGARFEVVSEVLGRGANGDVVLAREEGTRREVALKRVRKLPSSTGRGSRAFHQPSTHSSATASTPTPIGARGTPKTSRPGSRPPWEKTVARPRHRTGVRAAIHPSERGREKT